MDQFTQWLTRWKLPLHLQAYWRTFLQQQWDLYQAQVHLTFGWHLSGVKQLQQALKGWVLTPADHFPQVLHLCCPCHYYFLLQRTFDDPSVFHRCHNPTTVILRKIRERFPPSLKTYSWSVNWNGSLPGSYILPKPSKGFAKARPIITYAGSWASVMGRVLGTCLLIMMANVFGKSSIRSVQDILRNVWMYMRQTPCDEETVGRQQDLIGFFNTVPHCRIVQDVEFLIHKYCVRQNVSLNALLQVHLNQKERVNRVFQGRYRAHARQYRQVCIKDLIDLTRFLLAHSFFKLGREVYRQHLGAAMGSQWSPVVCAVVAATREYMFYSSLRNNARLGDPFEPFRYNARYVDNRYMVYSPGAEKHLLFTLWTDLEFYSRPILLEEVTSSELLGFNVDWQHRTITFLQPSALSKLRSVNSAGPRRIGIAGFHARALTIARLVRPRHLIAPQLSDLTQQYVWKGFTLRELMPILTRLARQFQIADLTSTVSLSVG